MLFAFENSTKILQKGPDGVSYADKLLHRFRTKAPDHVSKICVFGCVGDRDRGKRAKMGAIGAQFADRLVVTSDNPRNEDPNRILDDVLEGIPDGKSVLVEVDRAIAIKEAIFSAFAGDVVLIAGKGHEDYQIVGSKRLCFDDRSYAGKTLKMKLDL